MNDSTAAAATKGSRRYNFVLPEKTNPVGGLIVLYRIAEILYDAGYDVSTVVESQRYDYAFHKTKIPTFYNPANSGLKIVRKKGLKAGLQRLRAQVASLRSPVRNARFVSRPNDVFVLPEYTYPEAARVYAGSGSIVMIVQDVFGLLRAHNRDPDPVDVTKSSFLSVLSTSEASATATERLFGDPDGRIKLHVDAEPLRSTGPKKKQIAYMPRKRPQESALVVGALKRRPEFKDFEFVAIKNVSNEERNRILRESLFFLSFSKQEGFGLPPAEAMAAECIVVGFTGVGGDEYFDHNRGFPIVDSDLVAFIDTVEALAKEYAEDPRRLDDIRKSAADFIRTTYSEQAFRTSVLECWAKLDAQS